MKQDFKCRKCGNEISIRVSEKEASKLYLISCFKCDALNSMEASDAYIMTRHTIQTRDKLKHRFSRAERTRAFRAIARS